MTPDTDSPSGDSPASALLVEGPVPDECTTKLCHNDPAYAVEMDAGTVSRRRGEPAYHEDPPDGAVSPYVCSTCRAERYPGVDEDQWRPIVQVATDGGEELTDLEKEQIDGDGESDQWFPTCPECEGEIRDRAGAIRRDVHVDLESGGYDRVPMPFHRGCAARRFGYECEDCGEHYLDQLDAWNCCTERPGGKQPMRPDGGTVPSGLVDLDHAISLIETERDTAARRAERLRENETHDTAHDAIETKGRREGLSQALDILRDLQADYREREIEALEQQADAAEFQAGALAVIAEQVMPGSYSVEALVGEIEFYANKRGESL